MSISSNKWRLIITEPLSGAMNMAIDEAVLNAVRKRQAPPTVRFYRWEPPSVTLGYFQSLPKEVNVEACQTAGVDVVRRLTGGRAVLHQYELTYSLAACEDEEKIAGSILQSYLAISRGLLQGLLELGVKAELAEGKKSGPSSAICFDAPSWYEMVVDGKKLIGSAQTRRQGGILQHGSILVDIDVNLLFSILNFNNEKVREKMKAYFATKATSLRHILDYCPDFGQLCDSFKKGFESALGIGLLEERLSEEELVYAEQLCVEKYSTQAWNERR